MIELFPCDSKDELTARESHYIRSIDCINKVIPDRTIEEYRPQYYEKNKQIINKKCCDYYKKNTNKVKEKVKEYSKLIYECMCGSKIRLCTKARHERSQKHQSKIS